MDKYYLKYVQFENKGDKVKVNINLISWHYITLLNEALQDTVYILLPPIWKINISPLFVDIVPPHLC